MLTQKTLEQILEVLKKVRLYHSAGEQLDKARHRATMEVANQYQLRYQTIEDACRRRLNLKDINQFRIMLREWVKGDPRNLKEVLKRYTNTGDHRKIDLFFQESLTPEESPKADLGTEVISFRLDKETARRLRTIADWKGKPIPEWLAQTVNKLVADEFPKYITELIKSMPDEEKRKLLSNI